MSGLFDVGNYSLKLEDLYRPEMNRICRTIEYSIFVISSIMLLYASFVVIKKSTKEMGFYKYLLLNQLIWNFLFDAFLILWQPIPLFIYPFVMAYSIGPFQLFGPNMILTIFAILFLLIIGMTHSLYFSMIFRVLAVFYDSWLGSLIHEEKTILKVYIISLSLAILIFEWPLVLLAAYPKDFNQLYKNVIEAVPPMKTVYELEPTTSGCDLDVCAFPDYAVGAMEGIALLLIPISIVIIGNIYSRRVHYIMRHTQMSASTLKLNRMLMMALSIHCLVLVIFLVIPVMVLYLLIYFSKYINSVNVYEEMILVVFTLHSVGDIITMLTTIKPYRRFTYQLICKILGKKAEVVPVNPLIIVSSTINSNLFNRSN